MNHKISYRERQVGLSCCTRNMVDVIVVEGLCKSTEVGFSKYWGRDDIFQNRYMDSRCFPEDVSRN